MSDAILVLNAGSSSLKFAVFTGNEDILAPAMRGKIAGIGTDPMFSAQNSAGGTVPDDFPPMDRGTGLDRLIPTLLDWVQAHSGGITLSAVGHRVVHGGQHHAAPARVTDALLADLAALVALAPLHQPHNLAAIRSVAALLPDLPQVACFDTSFHRTQSRLAQLFALPRAMADDGILRYGFHGLSYDYIASALPNNLGQGGNGRVIVCHLGNGASLCAMKDRQSVATSMGFTALDGLVMGTRCGTLDPGVVLYLLDKGWGAEAITQLLYQESGLLGVSGISSDMAILEASTAPQAQEAIDLFCYRAASQLAALVPALGGLDAIVFTAGIGEKSARVRRGICAQLHWMGVDLDTGANESHATRISPPDSTIDVLIIPTNEEAVIARATLALISPVSPTKAAQA
ncbi:acetate/propionate family kinase [Pseudorhodobacter ferrugineus]|uniref:acetate/propionate family kinase n=1 Tax=Pseudorhodobacter ferrugineus TaxID=77008 RepID=UPI0003B7A262|nr:acetate/propionate family kinase [Pseudorhodobacter ferrugineus]